jgi:hypothetical protein
MTRFVNRLRRLASLLVIPTDSTATPKLRDYPIARKAPR